MSALLKRLLGLLFPGIDGDSGTQDDPGAPDPGANDTPDDDTPADDLDIDFDFEPEPSASAAARETDAQRAARLEAELQAARRPAHTAPVGKTPDQLQFEEEETRLRDPNTSDDEKWRIQSNRTMRQSFQMGQQALMQAQDLNDRTAFQAGYATDARRAKYADRVEAHIAEMRKNGNNAPREGVYFYLLGKDIAEGKLKAKAKPRAPAADVPRGRSPNARSDVSARGTKTEHEKRRARLENMQI